MSKINPFHKVSIDQAVILIHLGSPKRNSISAIRSFLREFLSDRRVIKLPKIFWYPILYLFILPFRPYSLRKQYGLVQKSNQSPLHYYAKNLDKKLEKALVTNKLPYISTTMMRYDNGHTINKLFKDLASKGVKKIKVIPMFPQYSEATTASAFDAISQYFKSKPYVPHITFCNNYADNPLYISLQIAAIEQTYQTKKFDHLLISFHGLPEVSLKNGDPYFCWCSKTTRLIKEGLKNKIKTTMVFQSVFGFNKWFSPNIVDVLKHIAHQNPLSNIAVLAPGFAVDCLETLYELEIENRLLFKELGGGDLHLIPCLNDSDSHVGLLLDLIKKS
jgi:protoporphyrin/coproporphyrin ferrochelatase